MILLGLAGVYRGLQGDAAPVEYTSVDDGEIVKVIGRSGEGGCSVRVRYVVGEAKYLGTFPCSQLKGIIAEGMEPAVYYDEENPRIATLQSNVSKSGDALKPFLGAAILISCGFWTWRELNDGQRLKPLPRS